MRLAQYVTIVSLTKIDKTVIYIGLFLDKAAQYVSPPL